MRAKNENLVIRLINLIGGIKTEKDIKKYLNLSQSLFEIGLITKKKTLKSWKAKWKPDLNEEKQDKMDKIVIPNNFKCFEVLLIIDSLKFSKTTKFQNEKELISYPNDVIINDIVSILKGGDGNYVHIKDQSFFFECRMSLIQHQTIRCFSGLIKSIKYISDIKSNMNGIIGQSIASLYEEERIEIIKSLTKCSFNSIISLLSLLANPISERIKTLAFIAHTLVISSDHYLNVLSHTQSHGSLDVQNIGKKLIEKCYIIIIEFIRDWVCYGCLNDPFGEFFIEKHKGKVEASNWWSSKYRIVKDNVPIMLNDHLLLEKILSTGKAWNYIAKFSKKNNVIAIPKFDLSHVDYYYNEANKEMMNIIMKQNWLLGHLRVIHDFVLFCRGDFSVSLYNSIQYSKNTGMLNHITISLKSITNGKVYISPYTKENLLNNLDNRVKKVSRSNVKNTFIVYSIPEPLKCIIDSSKLDDYYRLSSLIWKIRITKIKLSELWRSFCWYKDTFEPEANLAVGKAKLLLNYLLFCSSVLNEWISSDVISSQRKLMEEKMNHVECFDDIFSIHSLYVNNMIKSAFLNKDQEKIRDGVSSLISLMENFCKIGSRIINGYLEYGLIIDQIDKLKNLFTMKIDELISIVVLRPDIQEYSNLEVRLLLCHVQV